MSTTTTYTRCRLCGEQGPAYVTLCARCYWWYVSYLFAARGAGEDE